MPAIHRRVCCSLFPLQGQRVYGQRVSEGTWLALTGHHVNAPIKRPNSLTLTLSPSLGIWVNTMYINSTKGLPSKCAYAHKVQKHSTFSFKKQQQQLPSFHFFFESPKNKKIKPSQSDKVTVADGVWFYEWNNLSSSHHVTSRKHTECKHLEIASTAGFFPPAAKKLEFPKPDNQIQHIIL